MVLSPPSHTQVLRATLMFSYLDCPKSLVSSTMSGTNEVSSGCFQSHLLLPDCISIISLPPTSEKKKSLLLGTLVPSTTIKKENFEK